MPGIVLQLLDLQLYLMRRQQVAHDPADHPMFDVIAVVGKGDCLQPRRLLAGVVAGVMPKKQFLIRNYNLSDQELKEWLDDLKEEMPESGSTERRSQDALFDLGN